MAVDPIPLAYCLLQSSTIPACVSPKALGVGRSGFLQLLIWLYKSYYRMERRFKGEEKTEKKKNGILWQFNRNVEIYSRIEKFKYITAAS